MPLFIEGHPVSKVSTSCKLDDVLKNDTLQKNSEELTKQDPKIVGGENLLYVNQREFAGISPSEAGINILGTEDATTCHIVILRHSGSGATCLAHCDGVDTKNGIQNMLSKLKALSHGKPDGRIELHMVGGFIDQREESIKLSKEIINTFVEQKEEVHILTAAITNFNDTLKEDIHFPIIYGLGVDVRTGEIFRATFPDKGPAMDVRSACHFAGFDKLVNIYDTEKCELVIGPFTWTPWREVEQWLYVPKPFIRRYLSTSPEQEPEYFEDHVRAALRVLHQHPEPDKSLFPDKLPWKYKKQADGSWMKL